MVYEVPKQDMDYIIPLYIVERVAKRLQKEWPQLSEILSEAKGADEVTITFVFKFKPAYGQSYEEGQATSETIIIHGACEE